MNFELRKKKILRYLKQKEFLEVQEMANELGVNPITIRRDFDALAKQQLLERTHGGAKLIVNPPLVNFDIKADQSLAVKQKIGKKASQYIKDGDIIFIDCGSTTLQLCPFILDKKIHVITNSLPVVSALQGARCSLNIIGGELDESRQAIHGHKALEHIKSYRANKAFIGVDAIDEQTGLWAHTEKEASISRAFMNAAEEVYVLADSSKFQKSAYLHFADITEITLIIDERPSPLEHGNGL